MKTIISTLLISISSLFTVSIYTHQFTALNGNTVQLSQYQGKKMLLVNIASESEYAQVQLLQLQQLQHQYADSVTVIAFPSNDFGNEPRSNSDLKLLLQNTYHITFPVSQLISVKDSVTAQHPLYNWLQHQSENGMLNSQIKKDFQKYLVNSNGRLIGVFAPTVSPLDSVITNAINQ